jgi:hypothetical protein
MLFDYPWGWPLPVNDFTIGVFYLPVGVVACAVLLLLLGGFPRLCCRD